MKSNIHPNYSKINVVLLNGKSFFTRSTYVSADNIIRTEVDIDKHSAWLEDSAIANVNSINVQVQKFKSKFGSILSNDDKESSDS